MNSAPPHAPGYSSSSPLCLGICVLRNLVSFHVTRLHIHPILRYAKAGSWFYLTPVILKHTSADLVINVGSGNTANRISPDSVLTAATKTVLNSLEEP